MGSDDRSLSIGALARSVGVSVETIRFYQRKGLLAEPEKPYGGIRHYGRMDVARLKFIRSAKRLGFSLDEIGQLLSLEDGTDCEEAARIAAQRLEDVRMRLQDLSRIESTLAALLQQCTSRQDEVSCPLIAELQDRSSVDLFPCRDGSGHPP